VADLPLLEKDFYLAHNSRGLEVIAIELDGDKEIIEDTLNHFYPSYPVVIGSESNIARDYNIIGIPVNLVIDKEGVIRYRGDGYNPDAIRKVIEGIL